LRLLRTGVSGAEESNRKGDPLLYCGVQIDCAYRADIVVEETVIVEIKAIEALAPIHSGQLLTYLRLAHLPLGLLLNFGAPTMKQGIKRVANNFQE
jgi:GxxExxY protein